MMEDANEIQEALSRSYGTPELDEDDLEAGKLWEKQCISSFRVWKEQLPRTFSQIVDKIPVGVPWERVYGTVFGEKACESAKVNLHILPAILGGTSSEGRSLQRPLLTQYLVSKHCLSLLFSFWFCSPFCHLESSPSEQQCRSRNSSWHILAVQLLYARHC